MNFFSSEKNKKLNLELTQTVLPHLVRKPVPQVAALLGYLVISLFSSFVCLEVYFNERFVF
jgi:hypothetical protein